MGMPVAPTFDQDGWRARTSVTDPSGVNTAFDAGDAAKDADWTQVVDQLIRVRFVVKQTNSAAEAHGDMATEFILQYNNSGAGWLDVGAVGGGTEDVDFVAATGFTDGDNTTDVIGGAGGSFRTGDSMETDTPSDTVTFTDLALTQTEIEVAIIINGTAVTNLDTIDLRLLFSAGGEDPPATAMSDTAIPTITVSKSADVVLAVDSGSFIVTGTAVTPKFSIPVDSGAFVVTGSAITPDFIFPVDSGSFLVAGTAVGTIRGRTVVASSGTFVVSGTAVSTIRGRTVVAASGAFLVTGTSATPKFSLPVDSGTFLVSGTAVDTAKTIPISAASGSFLVTGSVIIPKFSLPVDSGSFLVTGVAAITGVGRVLVASSGSFLVTGSTIIPKFSLPVDSGSFLVTGIVATTTKSITLPVSSGSFTITGTSITPEFTMPVDSGSFNVSGTVATLSFSLPVDSGSFVVTGIDATTTKGVAAGETVVAESGSFLITGTDITDSYNTGPITQPRWGIFGQRYTDFGPFAVGQFCIEATDVFVAGTEVGSTFTAGVSQGDTYTAGVEKGSTFVAGKSTGELFIAGVEAGQGECP